MLLSRERRQLLWAKWKGGEAAFLGRERFEVEPEV